MAVIAEKNALLRNLKWLQLVELDGGSPYVGVSLENGVVSLYRTGVTGFVRTLDGPAPSDPSWAQCSAAHLQECLRLLPEEKVSIENVNGTVVISQVESAFETELRVWTVPFDRAGHKAHKPGDDVEILDNLWLRGADFKPFQFGAPAAIVDKVLGITTTGGIIFYELATAPTTKVWPREALLRALSGTEPSELVITANNYYCGVCDGLEFAFAGHSTGAHIYKQPLDMKATDVCEFPAARLIFALKTAASIAGPTSLVNLSYADGVTVRDAHGSVDKFGVGASATHDTVKLSPRAIKVLVDAFDQDANEVVKLQDLGTGTYRFSRGPWAFVCRSM
jgi:hypothetical protein